jgi:general secretion pathway protein L
MDGETARAVALVPAITMAGWIGRLQSHGLDPDLVLPEPLLLPRPEEGFFRYDGDALPLYRGRNDAFSIEPDLAEIILPKADVRVLDEDQFEAGIGAAIADPSLNLRQGAFAKSRRWKIEWKLIRRLAGLAIGILLVTLAIQVVNILRYTYAADALEAEANRIASRALPNASITEAPAQLERRVTELGGNGAGYGSLSAAVFAAVRDTPNVELAGMTFDQSGSLRVTLQADGPASVSAFQARLEGSGLSVEPGPLRSSGGRPVAELTVRSR